MKHYPSGRFPADVVPGRRERAMVALDVTEVGPVPKPDAVKRQAARLVLAGRALREPDPVEWLGSMIDMLGLWESREEGR